MAIPSSTQFRLFAVIVAVFLVLALGMAFTRVPDADEAHRASEAYTLVHHGHMGLVLIDPVGTWLKGVNQYSYWVMPLHSFLLAGMFWLGGESLWLMRVCAVLLGCGTLIVYTVFFSKIFQHPAITLLFAALLASSYDFINIASNSRTDILCAFFGASALATYTSLRGRAFARGLFIANILAAAACMTHPYGGIYLLLLIALVLLWDHDRLNWRITLLSAVPYVVGLLCWGIYISRAPDLFMAQFFGNIRAGRLSSPFGAGGSIVREFRERYFGYFSGLGPGLPRALGLKVLITLCYLAAPIYLLLFARRRGPSRLVAVMVIGIALILTFFENLKWYVYVVHIVPFFVTALALMAFDLYERLPRARLVLAAGVAGIMLFQIALVAARIYKNDYRNTFEPVAQYVLHEWHPGDLVYGDGGFAFYLGFEGALIDDFRLGYYRQQPPRIVITNTRYQGWFDSFKTDAPEIYAYVRDLLDNRCEPRFRRGQYSVYVCRATTAAVR